MGYATYRIRRKTATGYDIYHIESNSDLILRFNDEGTENGTVEEALKGIEETLDALTGGSGEPDTGIDVTHKIDKVDGATEGNFPAFNADGSIYDSGINMHTYAPAEHTHRASDLQLGVANGIVVTDESGTASVSDVDPSKLNDITKVEQSENNGKIKINGTDTDVYTHPNVTKNDTTSQETLAYGGTFNVIDSVTVDAAGHVSALNVSTKTLPAAPVDIQFVSEQPTGQPTGGLWFLPLA